MRHFSKKLFLSSAKPKKSRWPDPTKKIPIFCVFSTFLAKNISKFQILKLRQKQLFDALRQMPKLGHRQGSKFRQMTQMRQIWSNSTHLPLRRPRLVLEVRLQHGLGHPVAGEAGEGVHKRDQQGGVLHIKGTEKKKWGGGIKTQ